jgi:twitching motility protein PilJ
MQLITQFRNTKLAIKFFIIFILLGLGFIFMGTAYYKTIQSQKVTLKKATELNHFGDLIDKIQIDILEATRYVKDFELTKRLDDLTAFNEKMSQVDDSFSEIKSLMRSNGDKQFISNIESMMDEYQDDFYAAAEVAIELGLTEESGLLGEFNQKMTAISAIAVKSKDEQLTDKFLSLRNLQINYLRIKDNTITTPEQVIVAQKNFLDRVNRSQQDDYETTSKMMVQTISLMQSFELLKTAFEEEKKLLKQAEEHRLKLQPFLKQLLDINVKYKNQDQQLDAQTDLQTFILFLISIATVIVTFGVASWVLKRSVLEPIAITQETIQKVSAGYSKTRSHLQQRDELGALATALDMLLDEKILALMEKQAENEHINDSIITVIQSVFKLSQRDLTVLVPVAEDVTGALADSINLLTESIKRVLINVQAVSVRVIGTSNHVRSQSKTVQKLADKDQVEIEQTLAELDSAVLTMQRISELAKTSSTASLKAIDTSVNAQHSVSQTIDSINEIRNTIHQAEKKIKRLGERSQEIGGIVGLINNIAERTHLLSLNASMHAAAAGEAGKSLMVVVDEVQRLAENSREATAEISSLVNNIQLETADTVNVINTVISNVVEGTKLAKQAGERMQETLVSTEILVDSVNKISQDALDQEKVAERLLNRAATLDESSKLTHRQMEQQTELSADLVVAAQELQAAVSVFKLVAD